MWGLNQSTSAPWACGAHRLGVAAAGAAGEVLVGLFGFAAADAFQDLAAGRA